MDNFETLELAEEEEVLEEEGAEDQELADPEDKEEEEGAEDQELADPESRKTEADAAFAELRRENDELQRKLQEKEERLRVSEEALGRFFDGDDKALKAIAYAEEKPLEQVQKEFKERTEIESLRKENEVLKAKQQQAAVELAIEHDLKAIQKIDPNVKSLEELGDTFIRLIASGANAEDAYYAAIAKKEKETKSPAKPPGKIGQSGGEKDFFTKEEVEQMSPEEVHKNYEKIKTSMKKW